MQQTVLANKKNQTTNLVFNINRTEQEILYFMRSHNIDYETLRLYIHTNLIKQSHESYKVDCEDITDDEEPDVCVNTRKEASVVKNSENIADSIKTALIKSFLKSSDLIREPVTEINNNKTTVITESNENDITTIITANKETRYEGIKVNNGHVKSGLITFPKKRFRRKNRKTIQIMQSVPYNTSRQQHLKFDPLLPFILNQELNSRCEDTNIAENNQSHIGQSKLSWFTNIENTSDAKNNQNNKQLVSQSKSSLFKNNENTNTTQSKRQLIARSKFSVSNNTENTNVARNNDNNRQLIAQPTFTLSNNNKNTNITANNDTNRQLIVQSKFSFSGNNSNRLSKNLPRHISPVNETIQPLQSLTILPSDSTSRLNNSKLNKQTDHQSTSKTINVLSANQHYPLEKYYSLSQMRKPDYTLPDTLDKNMLSSTSRSQPLLLQNDGLNKEQMQQPKISDTLPSHQLQAIVPYDTYNFSQCGSQSSTHNPSWQPIEVHDVPACANLLSNSQRQSSQQVKNNYIHHLPVIQPLNRNEIYRPTSQPLVAPIDININESSIQQICQNPVQNVYRSTLHSYPVNQPVEPSENHFSKRVNAQLSGNAVCQFRAPLNTEQSRNQNRVQITSIRQLRPPYKQPSQNTPSHYNTNRSAKKRKFSNQLNNSFWSQYQPYSTRPVHSEANVVPSYKPQPISVINYTPQVNSQPQTSVPMNRWRELPTTPNSTITSLHLNPNERQKNVQALDTSPYRTEELNQNYSRGDAWVPNAERLGSQTRIDYFNNPRPVPFQQATEGCAAKRFTVARTYDIERVQFPLPNNVQNPSSYQVSSSSHVSNIHSVPQWTTPIADQHQQTSGRTQSSLPSNYDNGGLQYDQLNSYNSIQQPRMPYSEWRRI